MSVQINLPQVTSLKRAVENKLGARLNTHNAFIELVTKIEEGLSEHMSETTLERLWGYSTREVSAISIRTLDVLASFAGHKNWEGFCAFLKAESPNESEEIIGYHIDTADLNCGARLRLSWMPDRTVIIRYIGGRSFIVEESINSSLKPGDRFECLIFQKGRELYLDHFVRKGTDMASRYVVGYKSGLTMISILDRG